MRAIIFDFDGTIADSFKVLVEIGHQLTHHDLLVQPEEVEKLRKLKLTEIVQKLGIKRWRWPILLFRGRRLMNQHLGEIKPFEGIDRVLAALNKDGYKLFILSSNSETNINSFLATNGLAAYFAKTYGGVGLFGKSRALKNVLKQNKLTASDTIYIGDEPRDIEASKRCDIPCIAVSWGFNTPETLAKYAPMVVVRTRDQLLKVLETWAAS